MCQMNVFIGKSLIIDFLNNLCKKRTAIMYMYAKYYKTFFKFFSGPINIIAKFLRKFGVIEVSPKINRGKKKNVFTLTGLEI